MGQADEETCLKQAGISDKAEQEKTAVSHDLGVPESREVKEPKTIAYRVGWWTGVLLLQRMLLKTRDYLSKF